MMKVGLGSITIEHWRSYDEGWVEINYNCTLEMI